MKVLCYIHRDEKDDEEFNLRRYEWCEIIRFHWSKYGAHHQAGNQVMDVRRPNGETVTSLLIDLTASFVLEAFEARLNDRAFAHWTVMRKNGYKIPGEE